MENSRRGWQIGRISGIPVLVDPSWLLIIFLFALGFNNFYKDSLPQWSLGIGLGVGLLYFASILLHELAHSIVAQRSGIKVNFVVLHFFGGLSSLEREPKTPLTEALVAGAGPLTNLILSFVGLSLVYALVGSHFPSLVNKEGIGKLLDSQNSFIVATAIVLYRVASLNLFVAVINIFPGLPLDGGRLLRALLWWLYRSKYQGTVTAARSGQFLGWIIIIYGVLVVISLGSFGGVLLILIGWMFLSEATQTLRLTELQFALTKTTAEVTMTRDFRLVDGGTTLREFADNYLLKEQSNIRPLYFATTDGRDRGWIDPQKLSQIPTDRWSEETVESIATPLKSLVTVDLSMSLNQIINTLEANKLKWVAVLSPVGSVAGVIDRGDILRALGKVMRWNLAESFIQQVKQEGVFPPVLPLAEISAQLQDNYN
ncbi:MAG: site-2 protease family protein [Pseudanabaenaceae cyanobacterium SKYGB_i_bin29]|nr:site-2 protease family protein [Pseudanabaenaceae cyanobacterium SKYG29]MDW8421434.1 site-2 protease family protein [Pseudanabaenaceae cyanobacterium SKYGB_i_bin29]